MIIPTLKINNNNNFIKRFIIKEFRITKNGQ